MSVRLVEFTTLESALSEAGNSYLENLAPELGQVYVVAITRDGCSACEKLKPKLRELSEELKNERKKEAVFIQIHVGGQEQNLQALSTRCKNIFRHYFYPTTLILLRTADRGAVEYYRNVSPEKDELRRNIKIAAEIASWIEEEAS